MVDRLAQLNAAMRSFGGDPAEAELIHKAMVDLMVEQLSRGHEIGDNVVAYYARPRTKQSGTLRDLIDLYRVGRKVLTGERPWQDWVTACVRVPDKTRQLFWRPRLVQTKKGKTIDRKELLGFGVPEFQTVVPKPEIAMPGIEAALKRLKAAPGSKHRKPDAVKQAAMNTIWRAFQTIPGSSKSPRSPRYLEFGQAVDKIYDTDLFDVKVAGRRFRRLR
jgi:hypothetical protein